MIYLILPEHGANVLKRNRPGGDHRRKALLVAGNAANRDGDVPGSYVSRDRHVKRRAGSSGNFRPICRTSECDKIILGLRGVKAGTDDLDRVAVESGVWIERIYPRNIRTTKGR